ADEQDKIFTPADIVEEPAAALAALSPRFKKIHLMGQSMGVAASYNTIFRMSQHPEILKKIGNVVGIAGYVGTDEKSEEPIWDGVKMPIDELATYEMGYVEKVGANTVTSPKDYIESMRQVAKRNSSGKLPEHIGNVLVFSSGDPLIAGPDELKADNALQYGPESKRKLIIRDESNLEDPKQHSMLWIKPENLIRAVEAKVSTKGPHYIKVPKSSAGLVEKA
ncbi:MAG TPA: hypothetical protein VE973_01500, partial [Candidatus Limnocylindria bacterium]|nr:hypothetical protein [Candidatus Limnocylindria bacterium]